MSIVSYPSKKADKKVHAIKDLLQCIMSSAYCQKKASTKLGHLISQVQNTEVKWSIKTCIVRRKQFIKASRQKLVEWIMKNSNVRESPIACDTLLITDSESEVKRGVPKILLECSMRQLHNELISSPYYGGLLGPRHADTNNVLKNKALCN